MRGAVEDPFAFMPRTHEQVWERWFGWRYPHFDAMAADAAKTLTGRKYAAVRVGWDGTSGVARHWHVTLFTLRSETPDPAATRAAPRDYQPAGFVFHHVMTEEPAAVAATPVDKRVVPLVRSVNTALWLRERLSSVLGDARAAPVAVERLRTQTEVQLAAARREAEEAIVSGLHLRHGFFLKPVAIVAPAMLENWLLYQMVLFIRGQLAPAAEHPPWTPHGIAVCAACTSVFRPRRRTTATYCDLCKRRPADQHVLGEQPFVPGSLQTVRAPRLHGGLVVGWRTIAVGLCVECGQPFGSRRDATACEACRGKVRQRRHRMRRGRPSSHGPGPKTRLDSGARTR